MPSETKLVKLQKGVKSAVGNLDRAVKALEKYTNRAESQGAVTSLRNIINNHRSSWENTYSEGPMKAVLVRMGTPEEGEIALYITNFLHCLAHVGKNVENLRLDLECLRQDLSG